MTIYLSSGETSQLRTDEDSLDLRMRAGVKEEKSTSQTIMKVFSTLDGSVVMLNVFIKNLFISVTNNN